MNTLIKRLNDSFETESLGATWVTIWMLLSTILITALYVNMLSIHRFLVLLEVNAPKSAYFWVSTGSFVGLFTVVLSAGVFAVHHIRSVDRKVRHGLLSLQEGELSTRIDLSEHQGCQGLEKIFNDTMEVVQHRIEAAPKTPQINK